MMDWQRIETAPKQPFKRLLMGCFFDNKVDPIAEFVTVGYWVNEETGWVTPERVQPTHWMPLPPPPTEPTP